MKTSCRLAWKMSFPPVKMPRNEALLQTYLLSLFLFFNLSSTITLCKNRGWESPASQFTQWTEFNPSLMSKSLWPILFQNLPKAKVSIQLISRLFFSHCTGKITWNARKKNKSPAIQETQISWWKCPVSAAMHLYTIISSEDSSLPSQVSICNSAVGVCSSKI